MACQWIRAARGFDQYFRPDHTSLDVNGSHLAYTDADFIHSKPGPFTANDRHVTDLDICWKKQVSLRPSTGLENFSWHIDNLNETPLGSERHEVLNVLYLSNNMPFRGAVVIMFEEHRAVLSICAISRGNKSTDRLIIPSEWRSPRLLPSGWRYAS